MPALRLCGGTRVTSWPPISMVPAVGFDEAGHHAQRRRLAAAAGTEKCHHLAVFDIERKVGHRHRCTELLLQIPDGNFGHFYTT